MPKLRWEDIAGGASGSAAPPGKAEIISPAAAAPQEQGINLAGLTDQLKGGLDLIKMIDQYVGLFKGMGLGRKGSQGAQVIEGQVIPQDLPGDPLQLPAAQAVIREPAHQAPAPAAAPQIQASADQVTVLLEKVIKGEGDIPLSRLLQGIKNMEPWLIKYALELVAGV